MSDMVYTLFLYGKVKGGNDFMNDSCCGSSCAVSMRRFLTREEKIELLQDYKQRLDSESRGVAERIADLKNAHAEDEA